MSIVYENKAAAAKARVDPKTIPMPDHIQVAKPPYSPGVKRVAVDRYFKQAYHDLEVERIWKKAWQWTVREEEIPEVGDYYIYDIAELSFIVVRTGEAEFKAYWNSCLHRGRKLREYSGKRATEFRCMFHGWSWDIHGAMNDMTCGWDFPGTRDEVGHLPEAKTGTWGGFVFINPDPEAESLEDFLGDLPDHFENAGYDYAKRWKQTHTVADIPANWKVVQEAFIEAWHVSTTHPQFLRSPSKIASSGVRWDNFGNWMRSAPALPTDPFKSPPGYAQAADDEQQVINQHWDYHLNEAPPMIAEDGRVALDMIWERVREEYRSVIGDEIDEIHDFQLFGGEMVSIWPNFHPWGGFSRIVYRYRPHKSDPNRSIMDVILLSPWPDDRPRPPPARPHFLEYGQSIGDAPELGQLARIFQQDIANMPMVHEGLKTSQLGYVIFSNHNEAPARHLHDLYDKWMGFEDGDYLARQDAPKKDA